MRYLIKSLKINVFKEKNSLYKIIGLILFGFFLGYEFKSDGLKRVKNEIGKIIDTRMINELDKEVSKNSLLTNDPLTSLKK